jgi:RNA polymerase sigma-70 factor (ECF subfamily)
MADERQDMAGGSDASLVRAAGRGEVRAFEELYLRHREFVWRVARRYAGDDDAAMDVAQEVFVHLLRRVGTLKLSGKLTTYLYPVAKNGALAWRRGEGRRREILRAEVGPRVGERVSGAPGFGGGPDAALADALGRLGEEHREVLLMRVVDEMTVEEVAAALGVPAGTVKSRLHHALAKLRGDEGLRGMAGLE